MLLPQTFIKQSPVPKLLGLGIVPLAHRPQIPYYPAVNLAVLVVAQEAVLFKASGALQERLVQPGKVRAPFLLVSFVTDGSQPGMGHHRECDMAMPTMPVANFIMVQPGFAFGH